MLHFWHSLARAKGVFSEVIIASELKISRVKPLFKNGNLALFTNYPPISLLPLMSKIFEYVIFHQIFDYTCLLIS